MVMDGQNHWGVSSSFQSVNWTADTYYTFTEDNIVGGSLRYYGNAYKGAPLWIGSVEGLRTVHLYLAQQAAGPCVAMFDNNATFTLHNVSETLEIECETSSANYDVQLTGSNATPDISGLTLIDPLSTVNTAVFGTDVGITAVTAHNTNVSIGHTTSNIPLFGIGTASLWRIDGFASMPTPAQYNAPSTLLMTGASGGAPSTGSGPLDFLTNYSGFSGAYSCARRLFSTYGGPLCNIRRAIDGAQIDFYPNAAGVIDRTSMTLFCASTTCYIAIEYDQSGGNNNAANGTASTQPQVVFDTAVNYSICGLWGSASNISLTVTANSSINNLFLTGGFLSFVGDRTAAITNAARYVSKVASSSGWELSGAYSAGFGYPQFTVDASAANGAWISSTLAPSLGGHIFDVNYSYSSLSNLPTLGLDGGAQSFQSSIQPSGSIADSHNLIIGNSVAGGSGYPGTICEVVLARQSLSVTQIEAIRRNQALFYRISGVL